MIYMNYLKYSDICLPNSRRDIAWQYMSYKFTFEELPQKSK